MAIQKRDVLPPLDTCPEIGITGEVSQAKDLLLKFVSAGGWHLPLLLAGLVLFAYSPAINNGFISDDFIMLEWVKQWREDFSFLFKFAPDVFRMTSYLILGLLKWLVGHQPEFFYAFTISVHLMNSVLLWKLLKLVTSDPRTAAKAAILFSVIEAPQEAVFWVAAMAYALGGFCVLACLLLWIKGHYVTSSLVYLIGLFSTESAMTVLLLIPLVEFRVRNKLEFRWQYFYLLAPTIIFAVVFFLTLSANYMVTPRTYVFGSHGALVLGVSLHRLMFPWLYIAALVFMIYQRRRLPFKLAYGFLWMTIALLPFIFLTYQNHVPSRQTYVPAMGLVWAMAALFARLENARLRHAFLIFFIGANIGYLWLRKDEQYIRRAAPTTQLMQQLEQLPAQPLRVVDFPLNPWIAKMTARMVPGWRPEMLYVDDLDGACIKCPRMRWNPELDRYDFLPPSQFD